MARVIVIHYGEIGLKGGNRARFERRLQLNLARVCAGTGMTHVERRTGRIELQLAPDADEPAILARVAGVPGVVSAAVADTVARDLDTICARVVAVAVADTAAAGTPFAIETRRGDKRFPHPSMEVSRVIGTAVQAATGRPVDLDAPVSTYSVEINEQAAWVFTRRVAGPGGLPVGTAGRIVALLSGGLDSPVAAWRMMRRGAEIVAAHFRNETLGGGRQLDRKILDLAAVLARAQGRVRCWIVPFGDLQRRIIAHVPDRYRMLVYKRTMLRLSDRIRSRERALGCVVGDSLGQVASQTLENTGVCWAAARPPVFAPLAGSDKSEIVAEARRIGTYDVSIRPYPDCCSYLVAAHPATRARLEEVLAMEAAIPDFEVAMAEAFDHARREVVSAEWALAPTPGAGAKAEDVPVPVAVPVPVPMSLPLPAPGPA